MTRTLLADLSDLFRREAEVLEAYDVRRREPDEDALREADRLHGIADALWERSQR